MYSFELMASLYLLLYLFSQKGSDWKRATVMFVETEKFILEFKILIILNRTKKNLKALAIQYHKSNFVFTTIHLYSERVSFGLRPIKPTKIFTQILSILQPLVLKKVSQPGILSFM